MPIVPAISNAVSDAVGVRIKELPVPPERLYITLKEGRRKGNHLLNIIH
ncbi:MAG: hypothetical protein JW896_01195 [Deltaproteobacteria bacterium]|nr:hypothetical protein [Deltaproteobacteria bacterium]